MSVATWFAPGAIVVDTYVVIPLQERPWGQWACPQEVAVGTAAAVRTVGVAGRVRCHRRRAPAEATRARVATRKVVSTSLCMASSGSAHDALRRGGACLPRSAPSPPSSSPVDAAVAHHAPSARTCVLATVATSAFSQRSGGAPVAPITGSVDVHAVVPRRNCAVGQRARPQEGGVGAAAAVRTVGAGGRGGVRRWAGGRGVRKVVHDILRFCARCAGSARSACSIRTSVPSRVATHVFSKRSDGGVVTGVATCRMMGAAWMQNASSWV